MFYRIWSWHERVQNLSSKVPYIYLAKDNIITFMWIFRHSKTEDFYFVTVFSEMYTLIILDFVVGIR